MATYNTAFGSLPGYNEMLGTTNTTGGGQQQTYGQTTPPTTTRPPYQAGQTFAQMQQRGMARPAPPSAPQAQAFQQYGGSQQAQQMRQRLQQQLEQFGQAPSRFDTQAFQQIRGAQAANLQQEYRGQQQALNEELARRGLSASSVGGGRMGDLAGQQSRALADLDARLLQQAAETQAQDRAQLLAASQGLSELAGSQDLAQFEANRVAQAATFENQLRAAQFGQQQFEQAGQEAFQGAQAEEAARQAERQFGLQATGQAANLSMDLQRLLGQQEIERAQLTGRLGEGATAKDTLAARQFEAQQELQRAQLTGTLDGAKTLSAQELAQRQTQFSSQQELERAQLTGRLGTGASAVDTLGSRQLQAQQELQRAGLTGRLGEGAAAQETLAAQAQATQQQQLLFQQAQQLSEQSGVQYTVDATNRVVPLRDAQGNPVRTSEFTQAEEARKQQNTLTRLDVELRRQLGLTEATGQLVTGVDPVTGAPTLGANTLQADLQQRQLAFQNAARLSEQSGIQYTINDRGQPEVVRDAQGNPVRTSAFTQAEEARRQQQEQFTVSQFGVSAPTAGQQTLAALQQQLQRAGITGTFDGALTQQALQDAYARAAQLSQITGQQYTVNPATGAITAETGEAGRTFAAQLQEAGITGTFGGLDTLQRTQMRTQETQLLFQQAAQISEQSGFQHTVVGGQVVPLRDTATNQMLRTSAFTQAEEARKQQQSISNAELQLRRQLGLMEATGQGLTVDAEGRLVAGTDATAQTLQARQIATQERQLAFQNAQRLSEQSGTQYTVNDKNQVEVLRDAQGNPVRTSAEMQATEARKLQSEELTLRRQLGLMEATGQGLTVDAEGRIVAGTGATAQTVQARQLAFQNAARLSEQSGVQYTVDASGQPVVLRDAQGNPVRTSSFTQAEEARKQQKTISDLDIQLRRQLGLMEATGKLYEQGAGTAVTAGTGLTQQALQTAYARAAQLTQETGIRHTVNTTTGEISAATGVGRESLEAQLRQAGITGTFAGSLTRDALQDAYARAAQLSQITGQQYTVNPATGELTAATGDAGRTFAAQLQAAGITGTFGGGLTQDALQNAYQRAAQLSQITGKQYTVNPATGAITEGTADTLASQLQRAGLTGELGGKSTLERLQQNLQNAQIMSQITGRQYTVSSTGELIPAGTGTAQTETARQFDLDNMLRRALGMSEATGYVYDPVTGQMTTPKTETVQGQIARSQILLSLANSLGNLTPEQIAQLLGRPGVTSTPTPSPSITPSPTPSTTPKITGETTTSPPTTTQAPYSGWNPELDMFGNVSQASLLQTPLKSIIESTTDLNSLIGTRYKIGGYYVFYDGAAWKAVPAAG